MRPRYAESARQQPLKNPFRFGQSPPNALLYAPFGYLPYKQTHVIWIAICCFLAWGVAIQAGIIHQRIVGVETRGVGILTLLIAFAPNTYQSIRYGNVSPLIGFLIGVAILNLTAREGLGSALAIAVAAINKYVTVFLLPLHVAMRRWRTIVWAAVFSLAIVGASAAVMGTEPFITFVRDIAPTLDRSNPYRPNQSLQGFLSRVLGEFPLPPKVHMTIRAAGAMAMLCILGLIFTRRAVDWSQPPRVAAATALLLEWVNIFSPIFWMHYCFYLFPLGDGWHGRRCKGRAADKSPQPPPWPWLGWAGPQFPERGRRTSCWGICSGPRFLSQGWLSAACCGVESWRKSQDVIQRRVPPHKMSGCRLQAFVRGAMA